MLNAIIDRFVEKYASNAKQRSAEWYDRIRTTVGGSEMSVIEGCNPYKSTEDAIKERVSGSSFSGNIACWWGTLFEDIIARMIEIDCDTSIKGADLTIYDIPGVRFSPDGYCVIRMHVDDDDNDSFASIDTYEPRDILDLVTKYTDGTRCSGCDDCREFIVLVEIKCPMRRRPTSVIPMYYTSQVLAGLCFSPIANFGMFVEACIKKRGLQNLFRDPFVAWGIVAVFGKPEDFAWQRWPLDLGRESFDVLEMYLEKICGGQLAYTWSEPQFTEGDVFETMTSLYTQQHYTAVDGCTKLVAFLPWIADELHYKFMDREPTYLSRMLPKIHDFHKTIAEVKETGPTHPLHPEHPRAVAKKRVKKVVAATVTQDEVDFYSDIPLL